LNKTPKLKIVADLHAHTISSGHGYSTVTEYAREAKKVGLSMIAITDHGPAMPGAPYRYHFTAMWVIPSVIEGIRVLSGIEANIINAAGGLDLADEYLKKLDVVIASFHNQLGFDGGTREENTETLLKVMRNPYVDFIGHPENPAFPVDIQRVVAAAKAHKKIIEINNGSFIGNRTGSLKPCLEFIRACRRQKAPIIVNSDSHICYQIGRVDTALDLLTKEKFPADLIVNTAAGKVEQVILGCRR